MNGPPPSRRVFLSQLPTLSADSKVRFLGCVTSYDVSTGLLLLEHNYSHSPGEPGPTTVAVDINNLLETVKAEELRVGAWLNVLGYVRDQQPLRADGNRLAIRSSKSRRVYVEAVMVFSAGAVEIGLYERILRDLQEVDRRVRRP